MSTDVIRQLAPEVLAAGARFGWVGLLTAGAAIGAAAVAIEADEKYGISDSVQTAVEDVIDAPRRAIMAQIALTHRRPTVSLFGDDVGDPYGDVADPMTDPKKAARIDAAIQTAVQAEFANRVIQDCQGTGVNNDRLVDGMVQFFSDNRIPCDQLGDTPIDPSVCVAFESIGQSPWAYTMLRRAAAAGVAFDGNAAKAFPIATADLTIKHAITALCQ